MKVDVKGQSDKRLKLIQQKCWKRMAVGGKLLMKKSMEK